MGGAKKPLIAKEDHPRLAPPGASVSMRVTIGEMPDNHSKCPRALAVQKEIEGRAVGLRARHCRHCNDEKTETGFPKRSHRAKRRDTIGWQNTLRLRIPAALAIWICGPSRELCLRYLPD